MSTRFRGWRKAARETLLTAAAAIGVLCAVAALAAVLFDIRPLVFRSGSMAPEIPVGSLALARSTPAEDIEIGDVISVFRSDGARVTHRVVSAEPAGGSAVRFILQGDANADRDAVPYVASEADRVFWSQPGWGRMVRAAQSPPVVFSAGIVVGILLVTSFRRPARRPSTAPAGEARNGGASPAGSPPADSTEEPAAGHHRVNVAGTVSICVLAVALAVSTVAPRLTGTTAAFTDAGEVRSPVTTTTVQPVTNLRCTEAGTPTRATVRWDLPISGPEPTHYRVEIRTNSTPGTLVRTEVLGAAVRSYQIQPSLLALGTYRISVRSLYGPWEADQDTTPSFMRVSVLSLLGIMVSNCA